MNYYQHHIGDFNNATRHLTRVERSIYREMIDLYYDTELPLTLDFAILCRKLMARSEEEVTAVEQLLNEFFIKTASGWFHSRCDEEIKKWKSRGWFPSEGERLRQSIDDWKVTRLRIFARDGYICTYCNAPAKKLECDHIIPISRGGSNDDSNLTTACRKCNRKKSNKLLLEF